MARATRGGSRTMVGGIAGPPPAPGGRRLIIPALEGGALEDVGRHEFPRHSIPPHPGASRSRQTSAPGRPDGRASRGTISPSPVQPLVFLSSSFNL